MVRRRLTKHLPAVLAFVAFLGGCAVSVGAGLIYKPAGVIVAGGFLLVAGLLIDDGSKGGSA